MSLDEGWEQGEGYPPEYQAYRRRMRARMRRTRAFLAPSLLISGAAALILGWGCFHDLPPLLLFSMAPLAILVFLVLLLFTPGLWNADYDVRILPYFQKSHPRVSGGCSFLSGKALARNCVFLDALALELGLEPFSAFGFADDLYGGQVIWHEPERGLRTVSGLGALLHRNPSLLADAEALIAELALVEANLQAAVRLHAPFCLLLRYGNVAGGQEMDVRRGYFCYSDRATLSPEECHNQQHSW